MRANTASVADEPVNFSNFSVQIEGSDPFTIRNGQYIGHDGFVVPKNFDEFYERFPQYVRNWVRRHADPSAQKEDLEDWTQDLLIHLRHLPSTSKHRDSGKEDIIQTFDPRKHYGANQARFQSYLNLCLANKFRSMHSRRMKDALSQPGNLTLDTPSDRSDHSSVDDEFCHAHSHRLQEATNASEKRDENRAFITEFLDFIRREDPKLTLAIEVLSMARTQGAAADLLGIREDRFVTVLTRLRQLGRCFLSGEPVPKQRKPYKKRVNRRQTVPPPDTGLPHLTGTGTL